MLAAAQQPSCSRSPLESKRNGRFDENDICEDADGSVLSGSLEALVRRLIPQRDFAVPDANYIFTLLLNIRTIISPEELMQKIVQQVMFSQNAAADNFKKEGRLRMCGGVLALCQEWTQQLPFDFRRQPMLDRLNELLGLCSVDKVGRQRAEEILKRVRSTLTKYERYERALRSLAQRDSDAVSGPEDAISGIMKVCDSPATIAQQLTHIELERFAMIGADEVVEAVAKSDLASIGQHRAPSETGNIAHYVCWFNRLSAFVAGDILRNARKRNRVQVIEMWIDVAKECVNIGNFNSVMAIVAGLSLPPVARLKRTWVRVEKSKLEILQHQLDPSGNFLSYRATLKAALWRADGESGGDLIIIPFFVLLLKDLYLIYHSSTRVLPNGHLNYLAFSQLAEHVLKVQHWKRRQCSFSRTPSVLQYLLVTPIHTERALSLMSFECEMAESSAEKEQLKKLKVGK